MINTMHMTRKPLWAGALFALVFNSTVNGQANIGACAGIENAQERLACYDRATESASQLPVVRIPRSTRPAPQPESRPAESRTAADVVGQDDFGLELKQERQSDPGSDSRTYTVVAARRNDFTGWTITFQGGGTWRQVGTDDYRITVGEQYTIQRASMNSYFLSNFRNNNKIRITRVE